MNPEQAPSDGAGSGSLGSAGVMHPLCPGWGGARHSYGMLPAYPEVVHVVHEVAIDLEQAVPVLQPPALGHPPQLNLPDDVALAAQLLVQAEAKGLCALLGQEVESGLPHALTICVGAQPMSRALQGSSHKFSTPSWAGDLLIPSVFTSHRSPVWRAQGPSSAHNPKQTQGHPGRGGRVFTRVLSQCQGRVVNPNFGVKFKFSEMIKGRRGHVSAGWPGPCLSQPWGACSSQKGPTGPVPSLPWGKPDGNSLLDHSQHLS